MKEFVKGVLRDIPGMRNIRKAVVFVRNGWRHHRKCRRLRVFGPKILKELHECLGVNRVKYFADYGTMLGIVRDRGFIKHDIDIDIGVLGDEFSAEDILRLIKGKGFVFYRAFEHEGLVPEMTVIKYGIHVDFFFHFVDGIYQWSENYVNHPDAIRRGRPNDMKIARRQYRPLIKGFKYESLFGASVPVPLNAEEILAAHYGKDWKIPDPKWTQPEAGKLDVYMEGFAAQIDEKRVHELISGKLP